MKMAAIRDIQGEAASLFESEEPVLLTRDGKISGLYVPVADPDSLPDDVRRDLAGAIGKHLSKLLEERGVTEEEIQEDFDVYRRSRR